METKFGFTKMTVDEFKEWIENFNVNRIVSHIQQHHTFLPGYAQFTDNNHFNMQNGMKNHHVTNNGWSDIGQHFSIFPDGIILTGRSLERSPACIKGNNANAVCIENVGNFDTGKDEMNEVQKDAILEVTAALCAKFHITANTDNILYHHWFNLATGERNNGSGSNKNCPGSNFFNGNKVADSEVNFIPLVQAIIQNSHNVIPPPQIIKYATVKANRLNVRIGPGTNNSLARSIKSVKLGSVVKVFKEENGWYKISDQQDHWISGNYTIDVEKGKITASTLHIRTGPGTKYAIAGKLIKGQEIIIEKELNNWYKLYLQDKWISKKYVFID
ncbi:MAG: SH3 domain-containing protein [Mariniphaga sp.]|nr:SH3 domain-containing protein [Mariniphaga sp.]